MIATQEKALRELLREIQTFTTQKKLDLRALFAKKDQRQQNFIDVALFGEIMADNQMELGKEDMKLVIDKYDITGRGRIFYNTFCDDI